MTKLWFKTRDGKIVDLSTIDQISIECLLPTKRYFVAATKKDYTYTFAEFDSKEEAQLYLDEIYTILTKKYTCNDDVYRKTESCIHEPQPSTDVSKMTDEQILPNIYKVPATR